MFIIHMILIIRTYIWTNLAKVQSLREQRREIDKDINFCYLILHSPISLSLSFVTLLCSLSLTLTAATLLFTDNRASFPIKSNHWLLLISKNTQPPKIKIKIPSLLIFICTKNGDEMAIMAIMMTGDNTNPTPSNTNPTSPAIFHDFLGGNLSFFCIFSKFLSWFYIWVFSIMLGFFIWSILLNFYFCIFFIECDFHNVIFLFSHRLLCGISLAVLQVVFFTSFILCFPYRMWFCG